jgi:hypothetical protein
MLCKARYMHGNTLRRGTRFLPRMDRILCVVQELTDDSCRAMRCTIHKMNWTKPLGHSGSPLEDCKGSWWIGRGGGPTGRSRRALGTWQYPRHPRLFLPSGHPRTETCRRSSGLGTHGERADVSSLGAPADHTSRTHLPYGGRAVSDTGLDSLRGYREAITTKRPWWHCGQRSMSMPVRRCITVAADSRGNTGGAGCANRQRHAASFGV